MRHVSLVEQSGSEQQWPDLLTQVLLLQQMLVAGSHSLVDVPQVHNGDSRVLQENEVWLQ